MTVETPILMTGSTDRELNQAIRADIAQKGDLEYRLVGVEKRQNNLVLMYEDAPAGIVS